MKKTLFFTLLTFSTQVFSQQSLRYGAKAGLNISTLSLENKDLDTSNLTRFFFGGYIEKDLSEKSFITGEAQVSFQGVATSLSEYGDVLEADTYHLTQLNLPVSYNYKVNNALSIHGGGYVGFIIDMKNKTYNRIVQHNTLDLGLLAGVSYKINDGFFAQVRYNFGFLDIDKDAYKATNRVFQIGIGYRIK